ncbi:MAG TPA: hypothetical protein VKT28_17755 [Puia sp.]|nr:hypothetical protein [Puia sp.]
MVPINDIRIGNFLIFDFPNGSKVQHRSEHIHKKFDGYRTVITINDINIDKVHGIPLANEWLVKFGFEKIDKQFQHNWVITKPKTGEHYSIQFSEDKFWLSNSEFDAWCYVIRDVEYVHQLQNLYYDLAGEELTVKDAFDADVVKMKNPQSL